MPIPYSMRGNQKKVDTLKHEGEGHGLGGAKIGGQAVSPLSGAKVGGEAVSRQDPGMRTGQQGQAGSQIRSIVSGDAGASEALKGGSASSPAPARSGGKAKAPTMGASTRKWDEALKKRDRSGG